ncbi:DUF4105 domain-containing protein [uncultured Sphaerochaeta sp.]|uniref:lipoprotein N-acyltransferase Lnb domain-containing protein n=1 Tax=uncultured Sphaerochaeta sp. TaxID=886478 RepID=UPI0029C9C700|nr:DUF4105 domain-containing protein [uncultured Sphaerochaeta sp.]
MKRIILILILLALLSPLMALSIHPREIEQPFDSVKELSVVDFSRELAPNQEAWIDQTKIHLLTVGPGDPLYAWFGHSALVISQPSGGKVMYDWGIFDPDQPHFYLNFAMGRMYYYVVASEATWRIQDAIDEIRDVKLIELSFPKEAKFALISFLQKNIQSEYSTYLYHFYDDNCSTRIRDIINAATGGDFQRWAESESAQTTLRNSAMQNMIHSPLIFWALDFLQGKNIDKKLNRYDEMYLPEALHQSVLDFTYSDGTKLAKSEDILQDTKQLGVRFTVPEEQVNYDWAYGLSGLVIGVFLLVVGRKHPRLKGLLISLILLVLAVLGSLLLFMMSFSDMDMTYYNLNIIFVNPLLFIPAFTLLIQKKETSRILSFSVLVMVILLLGRLILPGLFVQDNLRIILLLLPAFYSGSTFQGRRNSIKR